jgi:hypothetical protein
VRLPIGVAWRGDAQSRGGFYFHARFMVNAMPNSAVRLFVGLSAQTSAGVCVAGFGSMPANTMGLWCDSGEVGVLGFVTSDSVGGKTKSALTNSEILTAGRLYEFIMIANPNQGVVVTQLTDVEAGVINSQNFSSTMPLNTAFMGPQVALSNASNAGGGDTAFDVYSCYLRPNLRLTPSGAP